MNTIAEIKNAINLFNNTNAECLIEDIPNFCNSLLVTIGNTEVAQILIDNDNKITNIGFKQSELGKDGILNEKILSYDFEKFNGCEI